MNARTLLCALVAPAFLTAASSAQISYSGGVYSQEFDTLPQTTGAGSDTVTITGRGPHTLNSAFGISGLDGWYGANPAGSSENTEFRAQNGSLAGGSGRGVLSFGATGSTDRALGALSTSNQINSFGAVFINDTADTLTEFTLLYTGEQWRRGSVPAPNALFFFYGLGSSIDDATTAFSGLDFVGPNTQLAPTEVALDGNDPINSALITATISGLNWTPGSSLAIRWNAQDQTGQDDGVAIDSLRFSAAVPAPGAFALLGLGGLAIARRRR